MVAVAAASCRCTRVGTTRFVAVHPERTGDCDRSSRGNVRVADPGDGGFDVVHRVGARGPFDLVDGRVTVIVETVAEFGADQGIVLHGVADGAGTGSVADEVARRATNAVRTRSRIVAGARLVVVRDVFVDLSVTIVVEGCARVANLVVGRASAWTNTWWEGALPSAGNAGDGDLGRAFGTHIARRHAANL